MRRPLGLLLLLAGTFLAARVLVSQLVKGGPPEARPLAVHAFAVPLAQLALLEAARRAGAWRKRAA